MGGKIKAGASRPKRRHIKFAGLTRKSRFRYVKSVRAFFSYLHVFRYPLLEGEIEFGFRVGEYINHLWLEGESHSDAACTLSALRRFLPSCYGSLRTGYVYCQIWRRTLSRQRALPLTLELAQGMAAAAWAYDRPDLMGLLLVGFIAFLRTQELLTLRVDQVTWLAGGTKAAISLPSTKMTASRGGAELVMVHDVTVVRALRVACDAAEGRDTILADHPRILDPTSGG